MEIEIVVFVNPLFLEIFYNRLIDFFNEIVNYKVISAVYTFDLNVLSRKIEREMWRIRDDRNLSLYTDRSVTDRSIDKLSKD